MGPGIGLQNRPAGLWKGAEEPGRAGQDQGPRPSGSHQPSSWVLQPGLGTSFLFLFHICHPSGWLWPNGWTQWFCSPLPIPLGTTGHIGQLKITLLKGSGLSPRDQSNCHKQRATLDPRRSCWGTICSGRRRGTEAPKDSAPLHSQGNPQWPNSLYTLPLG